jgi:predicted NBD/HSP70 family sugar kinase
MFSGVGCGIMVNGEIYRGTQGYAGEVSIYNYKEQDVFNCEPGNTCFLKRWELDLGIVEEVKAMLAKDKERALHFCKLTSATVENVDLKSVFIAGRAHDPIAAEALSHAAKRLGIKIAFLVNFLNPETVIIGGGLEEAGDEFLNRVTATIKDWSFREATENLKVSYSQLRENAVALGAASLVMQKVFAQL